jgi:uncharacterized Tic20 family protein
MSIADEIERLNKLRESGAITEEEFQTLKETEMAKNRSAGEKVKDAVDGVVKDEQMWAMCIHFTQLLGWAFPVAGFLAPIIIWQVKKDESEFLDWHGRMVTNWIISQIIFGVIFALLSIILIGIPFAIALAVMGIVFPIIGGLKANNRECWEYPFTIAFFKLKTNEALRP